MGKSLSSDSVSLRDVFQLQNDTKNSFENAIDKLDKSLSKSIDSLTNRFNTLESGRLSVIETKVANMEGKYTMIPFIISLAINIFFMVVSFFINK